MSRVMTGQVFDPTSGVEELATHGHEGHRGAVAPTGGTSVLDLLDLVPVPVGTTPDALVDRLPLVVPSADVEVVLDPQWLVDLHDPTLVISPGYVGPDRRGVDRPDREQAHGTDWWTRLFRRAVQVVVTTVAVVVPLVLIATPAAPPTTRSTPPVAAKVVPAPTTVRGHRPPRAATRAARNAAARQRALARATARAAGAGPVATLTSATPDGASRRGPLAGAHVRTDRIRVASATQVAERRADRATARAAARGAARPRHGGRDTTPPVG